MIIRKRALVHWLVLLTAFWWVLVKLVAKLPGPLSLMRYMPDGLLLILMILTARRSRIPVRRVLGPYVALVVGFFVYALAVYMFHFQSPFYFLWGFRNNFRFYVAFFAFIFYLDSRDVDTWYKTVDVMFWVNAALSVIQFVLMDVKGDFLGGIFLVEGASNAYTMLLLCTVVLRSLLLVFSGREKMTACLSKCITAMIIAAMAELKFFFVVFLMLLFMAAVLSKLSVRGIIVLLIGVIAVFYCVSLVSQWFGSGAFFTLEAIIGLATQESYSSGNDVNRLSAIPTLMNTIVTDPYDRLFGLGLGNCDTSSFAICNTPFYQRYGDLHYTWFTSATVFLETGLVGFGLHLLFFILCGSKAYKRIKAGEDHLLDNQIALTMALLCCILTFYNSSLRIEAAYLVYFLFAVPYIRGKSSGKITQ